MIYDIERYDNKIFITTEYVLEHHIASAICDNYVKNTFKFRKEEHLIESFNNWMLNIKNQIVDIAKEHNAKVENTIYSYAFSDGYYYGICNFYNTRVECCTLRILSICNIIG